jgi:hypothetical protein
MLASAAPVYPALRSGSELRQRGFRILERCRNRFPGTNSMNTIAVVKNVPGSGSEATSIEFRFETYRPAWLSPGSQSVRSHRKETDPRCRRRAQDPPEPLLVYNRRSPFRLKSRL